MSTRKIVLNVTKEQEEVIKALFGHYNWDFEGLSGNKGTRKRKHSDCSGEKNSNPGNSNVETQNVEQDESAECPFCFLSPCVTERTMYWLGDGQCACEENSSIRKSKYSSYWKVLNHLGTWSDPRYLEVKLQRANGGEWAVKHRREVMPVCVLKNVRTLYPNPKGKPYMDHKWK